MTVELPHHGLKVQDGRTEALAGSEALHGDPEGHGGIAPVVAQGLSSVGVVPWDGPLVEFEDRQQLNAVYPQAEKVWDLLQEAEEGAAAGYSAVRVLCKAANVGLIDDQVAELQARRRHPLPIEGLENPEVWHNRRGTVLGKVLAPIPSGRTNGSIQDASAWVDGPWRFRHRRTVLAQGRVKKPGVAEACAGKREPHLDVPSGPSAVLLRLEPEQDPGPLR
mmetsp:Transcript_114809/g.256256  ORF Transcript_114809/g.256256 Transcript_114809/m.256256 type:complete len:221 (+) Transcript_114809:1807-2469(+)